MAPSPSAHSPPPPSTIIITTISLASLGRIVTVSLAYGSFDSLALRLVQLYNSLASLVYQLLSSSSAVVVVDSPPFGRFVIRSSITSSSTTAELESSLLTAHSAFGFARLCLAVVEDVDWSSNNDCNAPEVHVLHRIILHCTATSTKGRRSCV